MFRSLAALQWTLFWFASVVVYIIQRRFMPDYGFGGDSTVIGNFYWAGLVVVFWTWIITLLIKYIRKHRKIKVNEGI